MNLTPHEADLQAHELRDHARTLAETALQLPPPAQRSLAARIEALLRKAAECETKASAIYS